MGLLQACFSARKEVLKDLTRPFQPPRRYCEACAALYVPGKIVKAVFTHVKLLQASYHKSSFHHSWWSCEARARRDKPIKPPMLCCQEGSRNYFSPLWRPCETRYVRESPDQSHFNLRGGAVKPGQACLCASCELLQYRGAV